MLVDRNGAEQAFFAVVTTFAIFPLAVGVAVVFASFGDADVGVVVCGKTTKASGAAVVVGGLCASGAGGLFEGVAVVTQRTGAELGIDFGNIGCRTVFSGKIPLLCVAFVRSLGWISEVASASALVRWSITCAGQTAHQLAICASTAGVGTGVT